MSSPPWIVTEVSSRLDLFLSRATGLSRVFVQSQVKKGNVHVNGLVVDRPSYHVKPGDEVNASFQEIVFPSLEPVEGALDILYEDEQLLVVNKPQGLVVHPASGHQGVTLVHYLLHYLRKESRFLSLDQSRPGIVHRLDRGTSGVLLIAKFRDAQEELSRQFKAREVKKEYECVVWGCPGPAGKSEKPVGRHRWDRKKMSTQSPTGRPSKTEWKTRQAFRQFSHLDVFPHTGRTHQIRVHLADQGFPIVGDALYETRSIQGKKNKVTAALKSILDKTSDTFLHAKTLAFFHPLSKKPLVVRAPRPARFDELLTFLTEHDS